MDVCTFFGQKEIENKKELLHKLYAVIFDLIETKDINVFYVAYRDGFEELVKAALRNVLKVYPNIQYSIVNTRKTFERCHNDDYYYFDDYLPEELEDITSRHAIDKRDHWLLNESNYVVTYINNCHGRAAMYANIAERQGKHIIKLGKL